MLARIPNPNHYAWLARAMFPMQSWLATMDPTNAKGSLEQRHSDALQWSQAKSYNTQWLLVWPNFGDEDYVFPSLYNERDNGQSKTQSLESKRTQKSIWRSVLLFPFEVSCRTTKALCKISLWISWSWLLYYKRYFWQKLSKVWIVLALISFPWSLVFH